jgi:hypothetical protein
MPIKKKRTHKGLIIAIALVAIIAIAAAAVVFNYQKPFPKTSLVGLQVGDSFTYSISGSCSAAVPSSYYPGFYQLNQTQYYKVAVTAIKGSFVTLETDWVFTNGTDISKQQTIDLSNGNTTDSQGFSFLFPANLKVSDTIYPNANTVPVNATFSQTYATVTRQTDYFHVSTTETYTQDPTQSTERYLYDQVWFDRQTGMLTSFSEIQEYNNPEIELQIIYTLTSTNVWTV